MALVEMPDLLQGTDEWLEQRRGMVTASVVGQLITGNTIKPANNDVSRSLTAMLVAERITGYVDPTFQSFDMMRGVEDEPRAFIRYCEHYTPARTSGFMVRDDWGFQIGYSPDGLVDPNGLIEIKSRKQKKQLQTILRDEVPAENMAQLQCGLLVSGREWCDYVSYCGGMPMYVKRVYVDSRWQKAIVGAVEQFEETAEAMIAMYEARIEGLALTERVIETEMIV